MQPAGASLDLRRPHCCLKLTEYPFNHDYGRIDDEAEIDRADGEEVGQFTTQNHDSDCAGKGERYRGSDDRCRTQIPQKKPLQ